MENQKLECLDCGSSLVIEKIGSYGKAYRLRKDGTVGSYIRQYHYEEDDCYQVYCPKCGRGYDGRLDNGKFTMYSE